MTTIGAIAVQGVRQANVTFGETVAVIGVGLVGVLAIQVLRAAGCRVIAIDLSSDRAAQAISFGAHLGLATSDPSLEGAVASFSRYGVDAALITAATRSADPLELAAKLLRDRGRISVIGDVGMGVSRANMYRKEISLAMSRSYGPGRYDPRYEEGGQDYPIGFVRWTEKRNMEAFLDLVSAGSLQVEPLLAHRFPVEEGERPTPLWRAAPTPESSITMRPAIPSPCAKSSFAGACPATTIERQAASRLHRRGRICARDHLSPSALHCRAACWNPLPAARARPPFRLALVLVSRSPNRPSELLDNPNLDAVFILTRHNSHADYVKRALDRGKCVFVEKPLAINREQLEMVRTAYAKSYGGRPISLSHGGVQSAFFAAYGKAQELLRPPHRSRCSSISAATPGSSLEAAGFRIRRTAARIVGELCHFVDWARAVVGCPMQTLNAAALPDAGRYNQDNVTVTIRFEDGSVANLVYVANGDRAVAKEYFEVFCGSSIARIDDFKTLSLSRNGKTETVKGGRDKGHRREIELTVAAMKEGKRPRFLSQN